MVGGRVPVTEGEIGSLVTFFLERPLVIEVLLVRSCVQIRGVTVRFLLLSDCVSDWERQGTLAGRI